MTELRSRNRGQVLIVSRCRKDEAYVWFYTPDTVEEVMRSVGRMAANPEVGFTWYDAAVVSQAVRMRCSKRED